jgi:hypothetical protein
MLCLFICHNFDPPQLGEFDMKLVIPEVIHNTADETHQHFPYCDELCLLLLPTQYDKITCQWVHPTKLNTSHSTNGKSNAPRGYI